MLKNKPVGLDYGWGSWDFWTNLQKKKEEKKNLILVSFILPCWVSFFFFYTCTPHHTTAQTYIVLRTILYVEVYHNRTGCLLRASTKKAGLDLEESKKFGSPSLDQLSCFLLLLYIYIGAQ